VFFRKELSSNKKNNKRKMNVLKSIENKNSKNSKNKKTDMAGEVKFSRVLYYYWKYARNYRWWFLLLSILESVGSVMMMVVVPYIFKKMVDAMVYGQNWQVITGYFWKAIFVLAVSSLGRRFATYLAIKHGVECLNDLIKFVFAEIIKRPLEFFENTFGGSLINQMEKFVVAFDVLRMGLTEQSLRIILKILLAIVVIASVDYRLGLIFGVWCVIYIGVIVLMLKRKMVLDYEKAKTVSARVGTSADVVGNILNIKSFSAYNRENDYYSVVTNKSRDAVLRSWHWGNLQSIVAVALFIILQTTALGYGLILWKQGDVTVGDIMLIQTYFGMFLSALWSVDDLMRKLVQAVSDAKEMVAILDQPVSVKDVEDAKELQVKNGEIVFEEAVFAYPNQKENVFNKFNLVIPAGQRVGLVGTSGAGKTTITKLLLRFVDLDSGKIKIDGQDISRVTQDSLRENIAYVPQEPVLFHRSIYENIAYANPRATKEEVLEAAKKAHVDEFVQTLEKGYETMVGERGVKLSGGQKQRVAIARAFLKNAPILILDEATSALDSVSEELIQDALFELMKNKTVIVVAHRLSTVQRLDRILVIEDGQIVEDGTHEELLRQKGKYAEFWSKQTKHKNTLV